MASPTTEREGIELEAIATEEVVEDTGQEEVRWEKDMPVEYPVTPVATRPPPILDVSLTQGGSLSSSRHYARLLSIRGF